MEKLKKAINRINFPSTLVARKYVVLNSMKIYYHLNFAVFPSTLMFLGFRKLKKKPEPLLSLFGNPDYEKQRNKSTKNQRIIN